MKSTTTSEVDPARSAQMARVRGRDTKPELLVRRALHKAGLRFRLQARDLPGLPDIVFRSRRIAIFVHGCFWHRHPDPECKLTRTPKSRLDFWEEKFAANAERDARAQTSLKALGWNVFIVWECDLKKKDTLDKLVADISSLRPA